jgi:hypothetical protein
MKQEQEFKDLSRKDARKASHFEMISEMAGKVLREGCKLKRKPTRKVYREA